MNAREFLAGGLHDFSRYEKREPARVYVCEPAPLRAPCAYVGRCLAHQRTEAGPCSEAAPPTCDICEAFGQCCCKLHRGEVVR